MGVLIGLLNLWDVTQLNRRGIMNRVAFTKLLVFTSSFFWLLNVQGQSTSISGRIIDRNTREGIPFAHIAIEDTRMGAISDLNGDFILNYPEQHQPEILRVSCLGYKPITISLHRLNQPIMEIMLEQNIVQLKEVVVKPEDPEDLLKEALRKVPENYDTTAAMLSGYYKMSSLLGDKNIKYTEAFIDIHKVPYQAYRKDNQFLGDSIRLREIRTKPSDIEDWKLKIMLPWEKSIYYLEVRDIAKEFSSKKNAFNKFISSHHFEVDKMVMINGRSTYKIGIKPKKNMLVRNRTTKLS